jgi:hypothetical protein
VRDRPDIFVIKKEEPAEDFRFRNGFVREEDAMRRITTGIITQ